MRLAELIPWRSFTIETTWPSDVAVVEIQKRLRAPTLFGDGGQPFVGGKRTARELKFALQTSFNNPARPTVLVTVDEAHRGGSRIHVRMRLAALVGLFLTTWMALSTIMALALSVMAFRDGTWLALVAWALPILGAALFVGMFASGARTSERLIREIFSRAPALHEAPATGEAYR
ncbi:MAG: hypothetical protein ABI551_03840 [Polyangiaceae bacterium]